MALPVISFTGNLTQDVEVFTTKNGKTGGKLKIACNDRKFVNNVVAHDRKLPNLKEIWQMISTFSFNSCSVDMFFFY